MGVNIKQLAEELEAEIKRRAEGNLLIAVDLLGESPRDNKVYNHETEDYEFPMDIRGSDGPEFGTCRGRLPIADAQYINRVFRALLKTGVDFMIGTDYARVGRSYAYGRGDDVDTLALFGEAVVVYLKAKRAETEAEAAAAAAEAETDAEPAV